MIQPTDKHREAAQGIVTFINHQDEEVYIPLSLQEILVTHIATAFADTKAAAFTAGRADRQAEDAKLCARLSLKYDEQGNTSAMRIASECAEAIILAPSSGSYEQRGIRAEIAEAVRAIPVVRGVEDFAEIRDAGDYRRDVLAAIDGGEKVTK